MDGSDIVELNVGGVRFSTAASTLTRFPNSMLGAMFHRRNREMLARDRDGRVFIDRDGKLFRHVLNFLRDQQVQLDPQSPDIDALHAEARFFALEEMIEKLDLLRKLRASQRQMEEDQLVRRMSRVLSTTSSSSSSVLRKRSRARTSSSDSQATTYSTISDDDPVPAGPHGAAMGLAALESSARRAPVHFDPAHFSQPPDF